MNFIFDPEPFVTFSGIAIFLILSTMILIVNPARQRKKANE